MQNEDELALAAVSGIHSGMTVGLGTGRAATRAIEALAERVASESLQLRCVATSEASAKLAREHGLNVQAMDAVACVDYLMDGADEVDPALRMIKGRGGAMTREKIVAQAATQRVYLVQSTKLVARLGEHAPLPIEVLRFGLAATRRALATWGLEGPLRAWETKAEVREYQTDNGNPVIDAVLPLGLDLSLLAARLDAIPGVVGHGLFLTEADIVLIEDEVGAVSRRVRSAL
jgi:ribose 5-phosphate isomerase A